MAAATSTPVTGATSVLTVPNLVRQAGATVNFLGGTGGLYDASKYAGISFKARVDESSTRKVRFKIGDVNTHKDGNVCKDNGCWNHFGKDLVLTPKWKEYTLLFTEAAQEEGWGSPRPSSVTPSKLISLDWTVKGGLGEFGVWLDDVTFLDCK